MNDIIIADAVRSAVGRGHKGSLSQRRPDELAADVLRGLLARIPQAKGHIDDVVLGCAMPEGEQGLNVARLIALSADLGIEVPAQTINRFCSSGLRPSPPRPAPSRSARATRSSPAASSP